MLWKYANKQSRIPHDAGSWFNSRTEVDSEALRGFAREFDTLTQPNPSSKIAPNPDINHIYQLLQTDIVFYYGHKLAARTICTKTEGALRLQAVLILFLSATYCKWQRTYSTRSQIFAWYILSSPLIILLIISSENLQKMKCK